MACKHSRTDGIVIHQVPTSGIVETLRPAAGVQPNRMIAEESSFDDDVFDDFPLERDVPLVHARRASAVPVYQAPERPGCRRRESCSALDRNWLRREPSG